MAQRPSAVLPRSTSSTAGNGEPPLEFWETLIPTRQTVNAGSFLARYQTSLGSSGSRSRTARGSGGPDVDEALGTGLHASPGTPSLVGPHGEHRLGVGRACAFPSPFPAPAWLWVVGLAGEAAEHVIPSPHRGAGALPVVVTGSLTQGQSLKAHPAPVELCNPSK